MTEKKEKKASNDNANDNNSISEDIAIFEALDESLGDWQSSKGSFGNKVRRKHIERKTAEVKREVNKKLKILLADLKANQLNKEIAVDCQIIGEGELQAIPTHITFQCANCGEREDWEFNTDPTFISKLDDIQREEHFAILQDLIYTPRGKLLSKMRATGKELLTPNCLENNGKDHYLKISINGNTELQIIFIKDLLDGNTQRLETQIGKPIKAYLIGNKTNGSKKVRLRGSLAVDSKDNNIRPIAFQIEPLADELQHFNLKVADKTTFNKFKKLTLDIIDESIAPKVVGRIDAKIALLLTLHSVLEFEFKNSICYGLLRTLFFGDTKTCKSTIVEYITKELRLGEFINSETSSRTGIAYTIDTETRTVIWGSLVQNDLGFIALDGFQQLKGEDTKQLREAFEKGFIIVKRAASDNAFARPRIIACANPYKEMKNYLYACEALTPKSTDYQEGFNPFTSSPDLTRWHLFIPFKDDDVDPEVYLTEDYEKRELEAKQGVTRERIDFSTLRRHILWAWSRKREQIVFEKEATKKILNEAVRLQKAFAHPILPIVHNGYNEVIARVSVSFAALYHSTNESQEEIIITKDHVELAIEFLENMIEKLELSSFIYAKNKNTVIEKKEARELLGLISKTPNLVILETLAIKGGTSSKVLAQICNKSERTIKTRITELAAKGLVEPKRGLGNSITEKGIQAVKLLKMYGSEEKSDIELINDKITDLSKSTCKFEDLSKELPNVSDLQAKLNLLINDGIIFLTYEKDYRVTQKDSIIVSKKILSNTKKTEKSLKNKKYRGSQKDSEIVQKIALSVKNEEKDVFPPLEAKKRILNSNIKKQNFALSNTKIALSFALSNTKIALSVKNEEKCTESQEKGKNHSLKALDSAKNCTINLSKRDPLKKFQKTILEHTNYLFPREGLVVDSKNPYRITYYTPKEYWDYFKKYNGKRNIYCSVYSYNKWKANLKQRRYEPEISSVILDKIYIDLDYSAEKQQTLETAYADMIKLTKALNGIIDLFPRIYFSGNKGFAVYIDFKTVNLTHPKDSLISIVKAFEEKLALQTLDWGIVGDLRRVSRAPYSKHLKSGLYCTPITLEEIIQGVSLEEILNKAAKQHFTHMEIKESVKFRDLLLKKDSELTIQKEHKQMTRNWYKLKSKRKTTIGPRPIILRAIENISLLHSFPGAHLCRLAIVCELIASGYDDDHIVGLFLFHDSNAREDKTRYQVKQIREGNYKPFTNQKLREIGLNDFIKKTIGGIKEK
ncbi:MAG: hypothetical protein HZR80_16910 [Candidatus Heimdallarchaeota archaeon]